MIESSPPLRLPDRATDAHKGAFGRALLVGGSRGMGGSIALSSIAALKTGSGLVSAAVPDRCLETVASFHPGIMTLAMPDDEKGRFGLDASVEIAARAQQCDAVGCGPGMTTTGGSIRIVERLLQIKMPRVFDADALNCCAELAWQDYETESVVMTPHPGEFQRICGVSAKDRPGQIAAAKELSKTTSAVIVLKGGPTVVTNNGESWTNSSGNPGMATAGSGDVLTGVITSLLGQGLSATDAAKLGVWIHGAAGDLAASQIGMSGMTCQDILDALPKAIEAAH